MSRPGLADRAGYAAFGPIIGPKAKLLSNYVYQGPKNKVNTWLVKRMNQRAGHPPDLFTPDGFNIALMVCRAVQVAKGDNVDKMISALEGWQFLGPEGRQRIRKADHAMIQPMFIVNLVKKSNGKYDAKWLEDGRSGNVAAAGQSVPVRSERDEPSGSPQHGTSGLTSAARKSSPMSRSRSARASSSGSSARTGPARRRCSTCSRACTGRRRERSSSGTRHDEPADFRRHTRRPRAHVPGLECLSAADACSRTCGSRRSRRSAGRSGSGGGVERAAGDGQGARVARPRSGSRPPRSRAGSLSHGDKRRLELAMLLAADPHVILLDEPMAGVSPRTSRSSSS